MDSNGFKTRSFPKKDKKERKEKKGRKKDSVAVYAKLLSGTNYYPYTTRSQDPQAGFADLFDPRFMHYTILSFFRFLHPPSGPSVGKMGEHRGKDMKSKDLAPEEF